MMNKKINKCICAILACILLFPASALAAEDQAENAEPLAEPLQSQAVEEGDGSAEPPAEPIESQAVEEAAESPEPSAEPSESEAPQEPAATEEPEEPQPVEEAEEGGDARLDEAAVSEIKNMALTDGAEAARMLFAYEAEDNFYNVFADVLNLYAQEGAAAQFGAFMGAAALAFVSLSAEIDADSLGALPVSDFGGTFAPDDLGAAVFTCPAQTDESASEAFDKFLSGGGDTVRTAFAFKLPEGAAAADVYGIRNGQIEKLENQAGLYEPVAKKDADGYEIAAEEGVREVILVFLDDAGGAVSVQKAQYTVELAQGAVEEEELEDEEGDLPYVEGEVLVVFEDDVSETQERIAIQSFGEEKQDKNDVSVVELDTDTTVEEAVDQLEANPDVLVAQPNYIYSLLEEDFQPQTTTINDTYASDQWYLDSIGIRDAWDYSKTSGAVKVAVLDTGVDLSHPDLNDNIVYSWNAVTGGALTGDLGYHGTHVAGIIAAEANNGIGVAGVSYNAGIIAINVFYDDGTNGIVTNSYYLCEGYDIAMAQGARVVNMSLGGYFGSGGPGYYDYLLEDKIEEAKTQGIVTVCAGGNGDDYGNPITEAIFPGDYDACISVVPIDQNNNRTSYADYNVYKDISAPGDYLTPGGYGGILSTFPISYGGYAYIGGSSMATPVVSGVAAALIAAEPSLTVDQVKDALYATATDLGTAGRDNYYGWGKINAAAAVQSLDVDAPTLSGTSPASGTVLDLPTFTVEATGVTDSSGVSSVLFAVYNEADGPGSYVAYQGVDQGGGTWQAAIDTTRNQTKTGRFYINIWGTDDKRNFGLMRQIWVTVSPDTSAPTITGEITPASGATVTSYTFSISAAGVTDPFGVSSVLFAVYNEADGQGKYIAYPGINQGGGTWQAAIDTTRNQTKTGRFYINIWGTDQNNNFGLMRQIWVTVSPDTSAPTITGEITPASGSTVTSYAFSISAAGVTDPSGVSSVLFAVYNEADGQSKYIAYPGINQGGGTWQAAIDTTRNQTKTGKFYINIWGTDKKGNYGLMRQIDVTVSPDLTPPTATGAAPASGTVLDSPTFTVEATGVTDPSGVSSVLFAVYNEADGQSKYIAYPGIDQGGGTWRAAIDTTRNQTKTGKFYINIWGTDQNRNFGLMRQIWVTVPPDTSAPTITGEITPASGSTVTSYIFSINAAGVTDPSGVSSVLFAVYNEADGQGKYIAYPGIDQGGGTWRAAVDTTRNQTKTGKFYINIWGRDNAGNYGFMRQIWVTVSPDTSAPTITGEITPASGSTVTSYTFSVSAAGVTDPSGVSSVLFAVYNEADGQSKYIAYPGIDQGGGTWRATIDTMRNQTKTGKFYINIWGRDNAGNYGFMRQIWVTVSP